MEDRTKELHDARRRRLAGWMSDRRLTGREVAKSNGWASAAHVTNLLRGHSPFGEKVARAIEQKLRMPAGYLDEDLLVLPGTNAPDVQPVVRAVLALRDALGVEFMSAPAPKVEAAVRLILEKPSLVETAALLLKR